MYGLQDTMHGIIGMITITDNFLDKDSLQALENTSMVYSKVHWIGRNAKPENEFHNLVHKIFQHEWIFQCHDNPESKPFGYASINGATAWWNIRPIDPKPHSDLISYCTSNGVDYTPDPPPTTTFLYYLKAPDNGGRLNIYTKSPVEKLNWNESETDSIAAIPNRLVSFPIDYVHAVQPYVGNRVSIGVIFWNTLPTIYGYTNPDINDSYDRPWVNDVNEEFNRKLTEDYIGSQKDEPYLATTDQDRDAITALHSICFGSEEWTKLQAALDDKNCFALLAGCDEDGQLTGYIVCRVIDKESHGLWLGVRPNCREGGWGRKLLSAVLSESRARGAETYDAKIAEGPDTFNTTLHMHKKLGFIVMESSPDFTIRDGERHEFINHNVIVSLITGK